MQPDILEVLDNPDGDTDETVWIYCSVCDIETFLEITPNETKETP